MILYKKIKSEVEEHDYFGFENDDLQKQLNLNRALYCIEKFLEFIFSFKMKMNFGGS